MVLDRDRLNRAARWFAVSGFVVAVRAVMEQADPAYWSPETPLDYAAAVTTSVSWSLVATSLIVVWPVLREVRGALALPLAAGGFAVAAVGNIVEDVLDLEFGVWLFLIGLLGAAIATVVVGGLVLAMPDPIRWTGLFLIVYISGGIAPDDWGEFVSAIALLGSAAWLWRLARLEPG